MDKKTLLNYVKLRNRMKGTTLVTQRVKHAPGNYVQKLDLKPLFDVLNHNASKAERGHIRAEALHAALCFEKEANAASEAKIARLNEDIVASRKQTATLIACVADWKDAVKQLTITNADLRMKLANADTSTAGRYLDDALRDCLKRSRAGWRLTPYELAAVALLNHAERNRDLRD